MAGTDYRHHLFYELTLRFLKPFTAFSENRLMKYASLGNLPYFLGLSAILIFATSASQTLADNWTMSITVDNQYDIYFGDAFLTVPTFVGGDNNWPTVETWSITGVSPTAFLYVATASDHSVAQGFLGTFTNITTGDVYETSDNATSPWEVFPAGQYLTQLNAIDSSIPVGSWPPSIQPTSSQVQTAVAYATSNNLWIDPTSAPGYNNGSSPTPWNTTFAGIPNSAEWIWHDTGIGTSTPYPAPFDGFNHDEFLVFRVPGVAVPEPATCLLLVFGCGSILCSRRSRRSSLLVR